jgi:GTP-binding protein HflX
MDTPFASEGRYRNGGGEGENALEADARRTLSERKFAIKRELQTSSSVSARPVVRDARRNLWPLASIVGYTNAGKSTLFNSLTGHPSGEDKLFATLDPTTRRLRLRPIRMCFSPIRSALSASCRISWWILQSDSGKVVRADVLLHVVDVSHPLARSRSIASTRR